MGLNINTVALMAQMEERSGRVLTLGRQRVLFEARKLDGLLGSTLAGSEIDDRIVFRELGYSDVESLDVSDYEGADHVVDLNEPLPDCSLYAAFSVVFTGGTLEHVFDISQALKTAAACVAVDGRLIHVGPVNGWIDHGFYQLSPTWMLDYLAANQWDVELSVLADKRDDQCGRDVWRILPSSRKGRIQGRKQIHYCVARRNAQSSLDAVPTQSLYQKKFGCKVRRDGIDSFAPYFLVDGEKESAGKPKSGRKKALSRRIWQKLRF